MQFDLQKTIEALLLSTSEPITLKQLSKVFDRFRSEWIELESANVAEDGSVPTAPYPKISTTDLKEAIDEVISQAEVKNYAFRVIEGPSGYQIVTAPQFAEFVRLLRGEPRPMKLSAAALETVSIIAYRQPVTRAEIEAIRGVSIDSALSKLTDLELVIVTGRADLPGRPLQYGTSEKFLDYVGIKELNELPASDVLSDRQISQWLEVDSEAEAEPIADKDLGLPEEPKRDELPFNETFAHIDVSSDTSVEEADSNEQDEPLRSDD